MDISNTFSQTANAGLHFTKAAAADVGTALLIVSVGRLTTERRFNRSHMIVVAEEK